MPDRLLERLGTTIRAARNQRDMTQEKLLTQLRGMAIFENFEDMVDYLTPELLGYDSKDELMLRFERLYPAEMVSKFNLVGLFVKNMSSELLEKMREEKYLSL